MDADPAPDVERASEEPVSKLGRGRLLAGGLGALVATLFGKVRTAAADDVSVGRALLLGSENSAETTTGLLQDAASPALNVRNPSGPGVVASALLPREAVISIPFSAGLAGFGEQLGVVGSALPAREVITQIFTPVEPAGVSGLGQRFGVVGSALPGETTISQSAGVAGFGPRSGLLGSSSLPGETGLSIPFGTGVFGSGDRLGVVGSALPAREVITQIFTPVEPAGVSGLGQRFGVVGSALPGETTISQSAGVAGFGPSLGVFGSSVLPRETVISIPFGAAMSIGVLGMARGNEAIAIAADNPEGYALRAIGKVAFSGGGTGVVPAGSRSAEVSDPSIDEDSLVNVTLMDDPGAPGIALHYARTADGRLRVVLTAPARRETSFTYFVFDRG